MATLGVVAALCWLVASAGAADRYASCQDHFVIRQSTIIMTVDSRRRGATFLNITEVAETTRCLQACCDRPHCNAAIYDQKTRSCFLFDCGPMDDYRCLFTSHTQFVSATLRLSRSQLDLTQWGSQSQHEADLTSLKNASPPDAPKTEKQKTLERPLKEIIRPPATASPAPSKGPSSRCSRFQFECHSGECIAIYNACDGIPQCVDGSDEAAELACPDAVRPPHGEETERPPSAGSESNYHQQLHMAAPIQAPLLPAGRGGQDTDTGWDRAPYIPTYQEPPPAGDIFSHRQQSLLSGLTHFPAAGAVSAHQRHLLQPAAHFPTYEKPPAAYQPPPPFYDDMYQGWANRPPAGYPPYDGGARFDMVSPPLRSAYTERRPTANLLPPGGAGQTLPQGAPPAAAWDQQPHNGRDSLPAVSGAAQSGQSADKVVAVDRRPTPERPQPAPAAIQHSTTRPPANLTKTNVEATSAATTATQPVSEAESPSVNEVEFSLSELRAQAALQASESQGATIVLTLGLLLCSVLVVLGLCHMRCTWRNARRGDKRGDRPGLAHDADYLVNGMYL